MLDAGWIREKALSIGFNDCGLARCRKLEEREEHLHEWLVRGFHASLHYLEREPGKRIDPAMLVEGARTVVVCAVSYNNLLWKQTCPETTTATGTNPVPDASGNRPRIASYALARDYHLTIKEMLRELHAAIRERWPKAGGRGFSDTAPLLEKAWAVEAGLGWIGKNSLLIHPELGSFVLLGELVLDAEADNYDTPYPGDGCGECRRCMDACPNRAIYAPRQIDLRRCIPRMTIERPGEEAPPEGAGRHGWVFGCDICQAACPYNRKAPGFTHPHFAPIFNPEELTREAWLAMTGEEFNAKFRDTPLSRCGLAAIQERVREDE